MSDGGIVSNEEADVESWDLKWRAEALQSRVCSTFGRIIIPHTWDALWMDGVS